MSTAAEGRFKSLMVEAGCRGGTVLLNELDYGWPVGFGRFVLEAMNPNLSGLGVKQIEALGAVLGWRVREIAVHV
jgi:hypothetical protein